KPLQEAAWSDLQNWSEDDPGLAFGAFLNSCNRLERKEHWKSVCAAARAMEDRTAPTLRAWFESQFRPWALVNPDGSRNGLITGYYEPILKGSRRQTRDFQNPVFGPPEDMIVVNLAELYPELKHFRLRGRLEGRKLVPYYSRAEWMPQESKRSPQALLWIDDPIDLFFMQIQGSGQVQLTDGTRVRLNYADQNGHPYRSIGRWLIDQGELKIEQASMQGIKAWAKANPARLTEMLNTNPSLVFFRELPATGSGPQGAMGLALTPERSLAVDPRHVPLGAPIWLATTQPNSDQELDRLMLAQDTGGAIRGVVRADFYWGSGAEAGSQAGRMRQQGRMWVLLPRAYQPPGSASDSTN
ncbi:MAG: murein transglycosylase A, partial [Sulfuritalea sp.]|nr:murein transglycosylase A [Sulfuritalea sp.]